MEYIDEARVRRRRSVVFVDDERILCDTVRQAMARYSCQLELAIFGRADEALSYVAHHAVDLVVLDVFLPGTSGIDACRILRTSGVGIPIAVATGDLTKAIAKNAYEAGATYALEKPIDLVAFIATVTCTDLVQIAARQALVFENLELARNIAGKLVRKYASMLDPEDIHGPAMLGLCEAAARYDPARSEPFVAFAARRIRGAVLDEIRRLGALGRVTYKRQRKISGARRALRQGGAEPTDDRVAERLGLSVSMVQDAGIDLGRSVVDVATLQSPSTSPAVQVERAQGLALLMRAREVLPEPEASVIRLHYDAGMSSAKIAETLGLTVAEVSQLHASGVAMLQARLHEGRAPQKKSGRAWARRTSIAPLRSHARTPLRRS
jgi:RNA polymerase sigma factor for flagellar operon FliA